MFINDILKDVEEDVEEAGLGIEISSGMRIGEMLFADDFVGQGRGCRSLLILYMSTLTDGD